nr:toxin-antitoxin system HicB family antitoxin [Pelotomaculum sp. FP]
MAAKKKFPLRIDSILYDVLERWAAGEFRSVNSQIEFLLRQAAFRAYTSRPGRAGRSETKQ